MSQAEVFRLLGRDLVRDALLGFNCSIFAYGQTSSGKSHTMSGGNFDPGLIPRVCQCIFRGVRALAEGSGALARVEASYFEIYNEKVFDLLNPKFLPLTEVDENDCPKRRPLLVREDKKIGVFVEGLRHTHVTDADAALAAMSAGLRERTVHATKMNAASSRSHAVFVLTIVQAIMSEDADPALALAAEAARDGSRNRCGDGGDSRSRESKAGKRTTAKPRVSTSATSKKEDMQLRSKMSLIDLAGSERAGQQGLVAGRLTEGNNMYLSHHTTTTTTYVYNFFVHLLLSYQQMCSWRK